MNKTILISFLILIHIAGYSQSADDSLAVKNVVISFQQDFNDGAFKNVQNHTTEDWEHIHSGGVLISGRDNVLSDVLFVHSTFLKGVTMTIDSMFIRFITPNVSIIDSYDTVSPHTHPTGERHVGERWLKTYVVAKNRNIWLLAHDHSTQVSGSLKD